MAANGARKLKARKFNAHLRLFANSINALGLVVIGAGFVQPLIAGEASLGAERLSAWVWIVIGIALYLNAQISLRFLRDEESDG
jgi:hypothetical protein